MNRLICDTKAKRKQTGEVPGSSCSSSRIEQVSHGTSIAKPVFFQLPNAVPDASSLFSYSVSPHLCVEYVPCSCTSRQWLHRSGCHRLYPGKDAGDPSPLVWNVQPLSLQSWPPATEHQPCWLGQQRGLTALPLLQREDFGLCLLGPAVGFAPTSLLPPRAFPSAVSADCHCQSTWPSSSHSSISKDQIFSNRPICSQR